MKLAKIAIHSCLVICLSVLGAHAQPCGWDTVGSSGGLNGIVTDLAVYDDGSGAALYATGYFTQAGGVPCNGLAKWDGASWSAVPVSVEGRALAVFDDGSGERLYIGGRFASGNNVGRWDGATLTLQAGGVDNYITDLHVHDDGSGKALYVAGAFSAADASTAHGLVKLAGASFATVGGSPQLFSSTNALETFGGQLYLGGSASGISVPEHIAVWDGTAWKTLPRGTDHSILTLKTHNDGTGTALFAGGTFSLAGGLPANGVARWNGSSWAALGTGVNGSVNAMESYDDGSGKELYVAGQFSTAGGVTASGIAIWDGASWTSLDGGMGPGDSVLALAGFDQGNGEELIAGGHLRQAGNETVQNIASWLCTKAPTLNLVQIAGNGPVLIINGNLLAGHEYFNIFSLDTAGPQGAGPFLGLYAGNMNHILFLIQQASAPLGTPISHFQAASNVHLWGPLALPQLKLDGICLDVTGGNVVASPVGRWEVQ